MIHLEVIVADTAHLLDPAAYGAGALLRWESGGAFAGPYVEGGTVALVADVSLYNIWDAAGVASTTWYRTRISDAGGTTFSAYSAPFQTSIHDIYLSADQFRALAPNSLTDEALLILLDAAQADIIRYAGPGGELTEYLHGGGHLLILSHPIVAITSIVEDDLTLAADDYIITATGRGLRRMDNGTNPRWHWGRRATVTYTPQDDTASRQRVQAELVKLEFGFNPGLASQTIGTWSETYSSSPVPYATQRAQILASLYAGEEWVL